MKQLSARAISAIKAPGMHRVSDNLYVKAEEKNGKIYKSFRLRYMVDGKRTDRSLGSTKKLTLADARAKADDLMKTLTADLVVPAEQLVKEKRAVAESARRADNAKLTFREVAEEFIVRVKIPAWKNPYESAQDWRGRLERYAYPVLGDMPIDEIRRSDVVDALQPTWNSLHDTTKRVRYYIQNVFDYALDRDYTEIANPATARITKSLPEWTGKVKHQASLHYEDAPSVYKALVENNNQSSLALQALMLTAQRQIDVRKMRWDQINFDSSVWNALIAKKSRKHSDFLLEVPLPEQLMDTLQRLRFAYDNYDLKPTYVFESRGATPYISEAAMRKTLSGLGCVERVTDEPITMHGMRTTFKEWSRFARTDADEISELQLSHFKETDTRTAYARTTLLNRRAELMQEYADYLAA